VRQGSPPEVQKSAITLFNSLLCFANHYKDVVIPDVVRKCLYSHNAPTLLIVSFTDPIEGNNLQRIARGSGGAFAVDFKQSKRTASRQSD